MTDAATPVVTAPAPRERGWLKIALAAAALVLLPLTPLVRVLLPVEQTILLLAPALAALAVAGWLSGGRERLPLTWTLVAAWVVWQMTDRTLFSLLQGGWALLVAGAFGAFVVLRRRAGVRFLPCALGAIGAALAVALVFMAIVPGGPKRVSDGIAAESARRAQESLASWRLMTGQSAWKDFVAENPSAEQMATIVETELAALPATARTLFPALAALEALAAFGLAWALYHRIGRVTLGRPLGRLRDFRFNDHMVWGVVAGLGMALIPGVALVRAVGANLLVFFGALYTMRGVGVFVWMLSPGRVASAFLILIALLFWNVLGVLALGLGIGDTWLDWRARAGARKT